MPGQNTLWDKYGCEISNDYEMLVLEVNFSSGDSKSSFQSWCDQYGVKYPAVCATEGGSQFNTALQNNNYGGPKYLIYPDRTFKKSPSQSDYDAAGLVAHVHDVEKFTLTVNSGSGDGEHAKDASVTITADAAPTGKEFDKWTGDTGYLADPNSATTTVTMPAQDIAVTATYKDKGPIIKKDNFMVISSWESGVGEQGSSVSIDSSQKADTVLSASMDLKKSDEANEKWAWAQISGYADGDFSGITSIELTYFSNNPVNIVLDQEGLSINGESYLYQLPAASRGTVTLQISDFAQPSWVASADATPLDLSKVQSVSFAAVTEGAVTNLEVQGIYLDGFQETPIKNNVQINSNGKLTVASLSPAKLVFTGAEKGIYEISVFNVTGKKLISTKKELSGNGVVTFNNKNLVSGAYIVRMRGKNVNVVTNHIIK